MFLVGTVGAVWAVGAVGAVGGLEVCDSSAKNPADLLFKTSRIILALNGQRSKT